MAISELAPAWEWSGLSFSQGEADRDIGKEKEHKDQDFRQAQGPIDHERALVGRHAEPLGLPINQVPPPPKSAAPDDEKCESHQNATPQNLAYGHQKFV